MKQQIIGVSMVLAGLCANYLHVDQTDNHASTLGHKVQSRVWWTKTSLKPVVWILSSGACVMSVLSTLLNWTAAVWVPFSTTTSLLDAYDNWLMHKFDTNSTRIPSVYGRASMGVPVGELQSTGATTDCARTV